VREIAGEIVAQGLVHGAGSGAAERRVVEHLAEGDLRRGEGPQPGCEDGADLRGKERGDPRRVPERRLGGDAAEELLEPEVEAHVPRRYGKVLHDGAPGRADRGG